MIPGIKPGESTSFFSSSENLKNSTLAMYEIFSKILFLMVLACVFDANKIALRGEDCDDNDPDVPFFGCPVDYYYDGDGDGYHSRVEAMHIGKFGPPPGYSLTTKGEDCDDTDATKTTDCSNPNDPCNKIKNQFDNAVYVQKFDNLNKSENFRKKEETGFAEKIAGDFIDLMPEGRNSMDFKPNRTFKGATHVHQNNYLFTDENGEEKEAQTIKIHSPADVQQFMALASNTRINQFPINEVYVDVISSTGNFTLRFNGTTDDLSRFSRLDLDSVENNALYEKIAKISGVENPEIILLTFLEKLGIDDVISVYKIESDSAGNYKAKQVTKNTNGNIERNDC